MNQSSMSIFEAVEKMSTLKSKCRAHNNRIAASGRKTLYDKLPKELKRSMDIAQDRGASSWLSSLPIREHGFDLHKRAFHDALCLRYGWRPAHLPTHCICGATFTVEHVLSCPNGAFPTIRHNEIRDITAQLLTQVCPDVSIEPALQPLTGERLILRSASTEDNARLDVKARGFWDSSYQVAFFDVRVFNPHASTYTGMSQASCYRRNEQQKKRKYDARIREIEHGCFTPLVFSTAGGMGPAATVVYKRLAALIAEKHNQTYSETIRWLRCRLNFSLLRSAIMCIRGARSSFNHPIRPLNEAAIDLALHEGQIA